MASFYIGAWAQTQQALTDNHLNSRCSILNILAFFKKQLLAQAEAGPVTVPGPLGQHPHTPCLAPVTPVPS